MSETTTREVRTEFTAADRGLQSHINGVAGAFMHAHHKSEELRESVRDFRREQNLTAAAAFGVGYGIGSLLERIKDENAEFARSQKGIASVLASGLEFEKGSTEIDRYRRSLALAKDVTDELDETSARFGTELETTVEIYKKTALAAGGLGLSQEKVMDLTTKLSANALRFQVSGEQAVDTVTRALKTGTVRGIDPFSIALGRATQNMHKLTQEQRFERIQAFLQGGVQIADEMNNGIGGALAKIRNVVGDTLRDLTSPIFKDIAGRMQQWAKHLKETRENGKSLVEDTGEKLLRVFQTLADVVGKIREHWAAFAAITAGMKIASVAERLGGAAAAIQAAGGAGSGLAPLAGGAAGVLGKVAKLTIAAEAAYLVGSAFGDLIANRMQAGQERQERSGDMVSKLANLAALSRAAAGGPLAVAQENAARKSIAVLEKMGIVAADAAGRFAVNMEKLKAEYKSGQFDATDSQLLKKYFGVGDKVMDVAKVPAAIADAVSPLLATINAQAVTKTNDAERKFAKQVVNNNFTGGVHVTWKNEETDPDRAFVRFVDNLEGYVGKRTQAMTAEPLSE